MSKLILSSAIRLQYRSAYLLYLYTVSGSGLLLLGWGFRQVLHTERLLDFCLLLTLALLTTLTTSTVRVGESSITYAVDPIVSFATIPTLGVGAAIVIKVLATLSTWLVKSQNTTTWKKNLPQLAFNAGMHAIATLLAGLILTFLQQELNPTSLLGQILPWLPAAIVYDQINLWLLIGILVLQQGKNIYPKTIWREEWWVTQLFVITYATGGALLAFAIQHYDKLGIVIFFLPILLSAYAFRLYVQHMQSHMDNLEEIVKARTGELMQANRQKDSFLVVLSHDMMTPLANIRYSADLIRSDPEIDSAIRRLAELILRSQDTLFHMTRNILDIEKIQAGQRLVVNQQPCNLMELLLDITETLQLQALEMALTFHTEIDHHLPVCYVDPQQIERIINNLLSNAFKYTEAGGTVWLRVSYEGGQISLSVEDTGYGIPAEELPTIFEAFKRSPQHQDKAIGSGLGLAITKILVAEFHGTISVQSKVGVGSIFTVRLPVQPITGVENDD